MKYWERNNLRRGGSQRSSRNNGRYPNGNSGNGRAPEQAHERDETNENDAHEPKERKFGTWAEITIAAFTIVLAVTSLLQWGLLNRQLDLARNQLNLAQNQFDFAENEAAESSSEAAASLNVSQSAAAATADQASAMKKMAGAADRQATAGARQADAAIRQLSLTLSPNLDLDIHVSPYSRESRFEAIGIIANRSGYTIHATVSVVRDIMEGPHPRNVWSHLLPATEAIEIVPGVDHRVGPLWLHPAPRDADWDALMNRSVTVVFAMRLDYKDADGKRRRLERCVFVTGPYNPGHPAYDC